MELYLAKAKNSKSIFSEQECLQRVPASEDELRPLLNIVTERVENN